MNEFWQTNTIVNNEVCPVDVLENIKTKIKESKTAVATFSG